MCLSNRKRPVKLGIHLKGSSVPPSENAALKGIGLILGAIQIIRDTLGEGGRSAECHLFLLFKTQISMLLEVKRHV